MINTGYEKKNNRNDNGEGQQNFEQNDVFSDPEQLLQEFNYQISLHQQQQVNPKQILYVSANCMNLNFQ